MKYLFKRDKLRLWIKIIILKLIISNFFIWNNILNVLNLYIWIFQIFFYFLYYFKYYVIEKCHSNLLTKKFILF